ncbi:MAG: hypothetical protein KA343_10260 [Nitrosomonas sp.]|nr:hypothetical protein [Nitrosomonas sp.]
MTLSILNRKFLSKKVQWITAILMTHLMFNVTCMDVLAHNPHDPVLGLGISPNFVNDKTLFVAAYSELTGSYPDILRSTDGGSNWTKLPNGMDNRAKFSSIRLSPHFSQDNTVFVTTLGNGTGVYKSIDRGDSWQSFNTGLINRHVTGLEIAKSGADTYVLFLAPGDGELYRSTSTQADWTKVLDPSGTPIGAIAISPDFMQDNTVVIAKSPGNLLISADGGIQWSDKGNPVNAIIHDIAIAPGNAKELFLATSEGIFYSNDWGETFIHKPANLPIEAINNIAISPNYLIDKTIYCTTITETVFKSTNRGNTWLLHKSGAVVTGQALTKLNEFSELQISNTFSADGAVFLSAYDGLFISTDGGKAWSEKQTRQNLITGLAFSPNFTNDRRILATTYFGGGFYTSPNSGALWTRSSPIGWEEISNKDQLSSFDVNFVQNHTGTPLAIATSNHSKLGFSNDYGRNWNKVLSIPQFPEIASGSVYVNVFALSPNFDTDHEIYLGSRAHGVLQSKDGGISWRSTVEIPAKYNISSIAISPNYAKDKTAFAANTKGTVWRTQNGGDNWSHIGSESIVPLGINTVFMWLAISPQFATDRLILVGTNNGIYRSTNGGDSWQQIANTKIGPSTVIQQIEFSPNFGSDNTVFVTVRGKGLYRLDMNSLGWVKSTKNVGLSLLNKNIQFAEFRISPDFALDTTLIGASRTNVYISKNGGLTWRETGHPQ